ncbi:MAG TPA: di-heme oxidoredictase family protein [Blastocatellia bacterium]|nr:di-heme oxidoredictase family protein [Blastocatellia bacterium]
MRILKISVLLLFAAALVLPFSYTSSVQGQGATEAPRGFDNVFNGFGSQAQFDADKATFEERDEIADGLGPVYNAQACAECHQNPVTGGISQITELRAGHFDGFNFIDQAGGSLNNDRATNANIQERVPAGNEVRTFRTSLNVLGDGFVESIDSNTLVAISNGQPSNMRGQFIQVPVLEANGAIRGGRFGWKNQQASLLSFASDAYLNEQGITNRFNLTENTSLGNSVAAFDPVPDNQPCESNPAVNCGEDPEEDIVAFARFMRATKAPPRGPGAEDGSNGAPNSDIVAGSNLFNNIGCAICHVRSITTAPAGTLINGNQFTVPAALGNKIIHPLSDFLLHDVGTGDGIVQNGGQSTRNKVRTPPLWGMRTRDRIMHDGEGLNRNESILRHFGEANGVINNYINLSNTQKNQLIAFLNSL